MAIVQKRLCSEGEADAEHTYFYYLSCPNCGKKLGTSIDDNEKFEHCPNCKILLQYT